jgi:hypothetical protein
VADEVTFTGQSGKMWRYWAGKPLGTPGGFGGVYAAEAADGSPMAVKVVKKQRPQGAVDERLLRREIEIGKRVAESGSDMLLPVIDAADAGDALLLVMSQAEGGALADVSFPLAEAEAVPVLVDIATGLQDLHSILILLRDLKPANVLRHSGRWKLADFGIARDQEIGTQEPTFAGGGTPYYMAPELWELKSPTVKTDLYAFGCLGYELLAGVRPYTGDLMAIRAGHLTQAPPQAPCSDAVLRNLISRLMAKRPEERPQDAHAVLERLRRALVARAPVQEAIARGLGTHAAEQARADADQLGGLAADVDADAVRAGEAAHGPHQVLRGVRGRIGRAHDGQQLRRGTREGRVGGVRDGLPVDERRGAGLDARDAGQVGEAGRVGRQRGAVERAVGDDVQCGGAVAGEVLAQHVAHRSALRGGGQHPVVRRAELDVPQR